MRPALITGAAGKYGTYLARLLMGKNYQVRGCGEDIAICELTRLLRTITGFKGDIVNDRTKPAVITRQLINTARNNAPEWRASIGLSEGITAT